MGIVETAEWLHLYYGRPEKLCRNLRSIFRCQKKGCIAFLISKGMYRPIMRGEKGN